MAIGHPQSHTGPGWLSLGHQLTSARHSGKPQPQNLVAVDLVNKLTNISNAICDSRFKKVLIGTDAMTCGSRVSLNHCLYHPLDQLCVCVCG